MDRYNVIKVATFNVWLSGTKVDDGAKKVANIIRLSDAEVIGLQETNREYISSIAGKLGGNWKYYFRGGPGGYGILTKLDIDATIDTKGKYGCALVLKKNNTSFVVVNSHLHNHSFKNMIPSEYKLLAMGYTSNESINILEDTLTNDICNLVAPIVEQYHNYPLILLGDHNIASHLDEVYEWPVSSYLYEQGFIDTCESFVSQSFEDREKNYTFGSRFNTTWHTFTEVYKKTRRIDFIYYFNNNKLGPITFKTCDSVRSVDDVGMDISTDMWPSDHKYVMAEFKLC